MRPAGKGPLDSLYFDYPQFAARRVPELDGVTARHPVVIVGAGPIGMTAALVLARYGIRSVLIDRKDTFNDGSRAICIARPEHAHPGTDRRGRAVPRKGARLAVRPQLLPRRTDLPARDAASARAKNICRCTICSSSTSRNILHDAVAASDLIDMRWQSELAGIECRMTTACPLASPRRPATTGSTPSMCWPPTARARRSARCWDCG